MSRMTEEELRNHLSEPLRAAIDAENAERDRWMAQARDLGWDENELLAVAHLSAGSCNPVVRVEADAIALENVYGATWQWKRGTFAESIRAYRIERGLDKLPVEPAKPQFVRREAEEPRMTADEFRATSKSKKKRKQQELPREEAQIGLFRKR